EGDSGRRSTAGGGAGFFVVARPFWNRENKRYRPAKGKPHSGPSPPFIWETCIGAVLGTLLGVRSGDGGRFACSRSIGRIKQKPKSTLPRKSNRIPGEADANLTFA